MAKPSTNYPSGPKTPQNLSNCCRGAFRKGSLKQVGSRNGPRASATVSFGSILPPLGRFGTPARSHVSSEIDGKRVAFPLEAM